MAHLLVSNEGVTMDQVQKENSGEGRSIGKHKRIGHDSVGLYQHQYDGLVLPDGDSIKRRALGSIINQPDRMGGKSSLQKRSTRSSKSPMPKCASANSPVPLSLSSSGFFLPPFNSFLPGAPDELKPIGSEVISSRNDSRMSFSMAVSTSFSRSMETSISFESPMNVSTPDLYNCNSLSCKEFVDIDLLDDSSCAISGEYAHSIFFYLREAEVRFHPCPHYMKKQPDITVAMRCILVDWLVEVAEEFKLDQQTLYMSLSIVDRFLSSMSVVRSKLQLVGGTAMYLASKFEEIFPPEIGEFACITDDTYTKPQIVRMERLILKVLDFNLAAPTTHNFLLRYLKASEAEDVNSVKCGSEMSYSSHNADSTKTISFTIHFLSMYLCELALQDADPYLKYFPSITAASAVCLARHTMGLTAWPGLLQHYSGYTVSDISNCVQDMHRSLALAPHHTQQAIRHKYNSEKFHMVSSIKAPETLPC